MALSGSVSTNHFSDSAVSETYMTFSWSATQDKTANTSKVTWKIVAHRPSTSNYVYFHNFARTVNGASKTKDSATYGEGDTIDSGSFTITHNNSTGEASFSVSMSANIYYYSGGSISASKTFTLDTIPRKFTTTPVIAAKSKTVNTYTFNWTTSETCSKVVLYIDGTAKTTLKDLSAKSGTITATGLEPNTEYDAFIRCTRKDSGITSDSKTKQYTTYQVGLISKATNFNDEQNPTITYSNPSGNSVTSLQACISLTGAKDDIAYRDISKTGTSYTFPLTDAERKVLRKACTTTSLTVRFYIATTSGGTIYRKYVKATMTIKNGQPVFTDFDIEDVDATILTLTGNPQKYVRKYSDIKVTISSADKMVAQKESTAVSYNIIVGDQSKTLTYSTSDLTTTINNMDANKIEVYAVDSRGKQTGVPKSLDIIDYKEVALNSITFARKNNVEETVVITGKGTWTNVDFGLIKNSIKTFAFRKKKKTENTWSEWFSLTDIFNINEDGTISNKVENEFTATTFDFGEEYNIEVKIEDELSSSTKTTKVNSGKILMSALKEKGVCFGGIYDAAKGGAIQSLGTLRFPTPPAFADGGAIDLTNGSIINIDALWFNDECTGYEGLNFLKQNGDKTVKEDYETLRGYRGRVYYNGDTSLAFFDEAHPIGSYMITKTNTNPGDSMPGTWSLVDKELSYKAWTLGSGEYTLNSTNATSADIAVVRMGHNISFRITLINKVDVGDGALPMFTIDYESLGISNLVYNISHTIGNSDGGEAVVDASLNYSTGEFTTNDVNPIADGNILPAGSSTVFHINVLIPYTLILDSACLKFWWRRTA